MMLEDFGIGEAWMIVSNYRSNRSPDIVVPIYGVQVVETNEGMITSGSFRYDVNYGVFSYNDQDLHTLWNHLRKQLNICIDKSL